MRRIAVLGSGPGAFFTVKYLLKHQIPGLNRIDILEKLSAPFGLVRFGVAPDHSEVKEVSNEFKGILRDHSKQVRLFTNQPVLSVDDFEKLRSSYDAVLVATGAQASKRLPLTTHPINSLSAQDFVLWYNGHPEKQDQYLPESPRNVSVVGHGNVALDVARMLCKSEAELQPLVQSGLLTNTAFDWFVKRQNLPGHKSVSILGRRGYLDAAFTNKEFRELTQMQDATCKVDANELEDTLEGLKSKSASNRAKSRGIPILSKCIDSFKSNIADTSNSIFLRFFTQPVEYTGNPATGLVVERPNGEKETISTDLGIESIGFKVVTDQFGLPIDPATGGVAHDGSGRVISHPGVYVAGWTKRGPKGVIAANIQCSIETAEAMHADLINPSSPIKELQDPPEYSNQYTP